MAPKRVRILIDSDEEIRRALKYRANKLSVERADEVTVSDFLNELLRKELASDLREIQRKDAANPDKAKGKHGDD